MSATIFSVSWVWALCKNKFGQLTGPHTGSSCHCSDVEADKQDGKGEKQQGAKGVLAVWRVQLTIAKLGADWLLAASCAHPCRSSAARCESILCLAYITTFLLGKTPMHPFPFILSHPYQYTSHLRSSNMSKLPCESMISQCLSFSPEPPGSYPPVSLRSAYWRVPFLKQTASSCSVPCQDRNLSLAQAQHPELTGSSYEKVWQTQVKRPE